MLETISVIALVLSAGSFGVAAWRISDLSRRMKALEFALSTSASSLQSYTDNAVSTLRAAIPSSVTKLAAEVDDLRDAVEAQRESHRKFAGKVWGRIGAAEAPAPARSLDRDELRRQHLPKPNGS